MTDKPKLRGFAALKARDPEAFKAMSARGGGNVPADKRGFAQDRDLAVNAGRKGGSTKKGKANG